MLKNLPFFVCTCLLWTCQKKNCIDLLHSFINLFLFALCFYPGIIWTPVCKVDIVKVSFRPHFVWARYTRTGPVTCLSVIRDVTLRDKQLMFVGLVTLKLPPEHSDPTPSDLCLCLCERYWGVTRESRQWMLFRKHIAIVLCHGHLSCQGQGFESVVFCYGCLHQSECQAWIYSYQEGIPRSTWRCGIKSPTRNVTDSS